MAELEAKLTALRLERERNKQRLAALSEKVASKIPARPPAPAPKAEPAPFSDAGPLLSRQPAAQVSVAWVCCRGHALPQKKEPGSGVLAQGQRDVSGRGQGMHMQTPDDNTQPQTVCKLRSSRKDVSSSA